jgi:hypothetical protein
LKKEFLNILIIIVIFGELWAKQVVENIGIILILKFSLGLWASGRTKNQIKYLTEGLKI